MSWQPKNAANRRGMIKQLYGDGMIARPADVASYALTVLEAGLEKCLHAWGRLVVSAMKQLAVIVAMWVCRRWRTPTSGRTQEFAGAQQASIRSSSGGVHVTINGRTDTVLPVFTVDNANNYLYDDGSPIAPRGRRDRDQGVQAERRQGEARQGGAPTSRPTTSRRRCRTSATSRTRRTTARWCMRSSRLSRRSDVAKSQVLEAGQHTNLGSRSARTRSACTPRATSGTKETVDWPVSKDGWEVS